MRITRQSRDRAAARPGCSAGGPESAAGAHRDIRGTYQTGARGSRKFPELAQGGRSSPGCGEKRNLETGAQKDAAAARRPTRDHTRPHRQSRKASLERVRPSLRNSIALEEQTQSYLNEKIIQHPTRNSTPSRKQGGEPRPELQTSVPHGRGPEPHPQSDPWPASPPGRGVRGRPFLTLADPIPSLSPKTGPG